jgi:hypothetical protein
MLRRPVNKGFACCKSLGQNDGNERSNGLQIRYSILDPCVLTLLQQGWCLAEDAKGRCFDRAEGVAS